MNLLLISCAFLAVASVSFGMLLLRREQAAAPEGFEDSNGFHPSYPATATTESSSWAA